jgi:hypothetical protein
MNNKRKMKKKNIYLAIFYWRKFSFLGELEGVVLGFELRALSLEKLFLIRMSVNKMEPKSNMHMKSKILLYDKCFSAGNLKI